VASTMGMVGKAVQPEEVVLNGLKRSRHSLHFNARRLRHWVLAHLAGAPAHTADERETASSHLGGSRATLGRLVDEYTTAHFARQRV
jgi:hypothetical protein